MTRSKKLSVCLHRM